MVMFLKKCVNYTLKIKRSVNASKPILFQNAYFGTSKQSFLKTKYGGRFVVSMIAGDDFGCELMKHVKGMFQIGGVPVDFEELHLDCTDQFAGKIDEVITSVRRNGVAIKGNIVTRWDDFEFRSRNVILRKELNLFANVLHCKNQPGIKTRHDNVDLILIRQNTEGEYSCLEHESIPGVVESLKIVTKERSEEIARFAFEYAVKKNRKKVTAVHKASVMPLTDGLFLKACCDVSYDYPGIQYDVVFLDTCCMLLVTNPMLFDVLLLPNLYGNVLNNIACGLIGGAGIASGQNYGHDCVIFEIGSRSSGTTNSILYVNPVPMLKASVDLLDYLGLKIHSEIIGNAVYQTLNYDKILTPDLGGYARTSDVVNHVVKIIRSKTPTVKF